MSTKGRAFDRSAIVLLGATLLASVLALAAPAVAQASPEFDPAAAQVARGRAAYNANCSSCHGFRLTDGAARPLRGDPFSARWLATPEQLRALDDKLRTMPSGSPDSLPAQTYADLKAYILSVNNYAPGGAKAPAARKAEALDIPAAPASVAAASTAAPTDAELLAPADSDWPMFNRNYAGDRFSPLAEINTGNAGHLQVACILQTGEPGSFETSPVIYKGVGYVTTTYSTIAFDAATCRRKWTYAYSPTGAEFQLINRGVALYAGAVYRVTTDAHLLAIDSVTGKLLWDAQVADSSLGSHGTGAPIVYHGMVIVSLAGSDYGQAGHIYAFDAKTGRRVWIFNTVPTGKEPGAESWTVGAANGGGASWSSFAADPKDNLVLAPIGNPSPDFLKAARPGDNLYTDSVVALDAASGKLVWYEQQRPADYHDWDTASAPVLFEQDGHRRMAEGSKDGYVYLYDRDAHTLIAKTPVTTILNENVPLVLGKPITSCPGIAGGVLWNGEAYSPISKALFVGAVDLCSTTTLGEAEPPKPRVLWYDGKWTFSGEGTGWIKALDGASGRELWSYHAPALVVAGVTATAGGVVLAGVSNGDFLVFDAKDGRILYRFFAGGAVAGGISTYAVGDRQYVAVATGNRGGVSMTVNLPASPTLVVFALPR